ncbi:MAG: hypothetical protein WCA44_08870 [Acidobacteriaceae bacterium]
MRALTESLELAGTVPEVNVAPEEYARLLGYPRGHILEGRAKDLAEWARGWYGEHGQPWFYARQAENFSLAGDSILVDGVLFTSQRLHGTLQQAEAHSVVLVAVGAGQEAEEESRRLWEDEKPDEYFFLEIFGSAVVEHLTTTIRAHLCSWAEERGMAVLPHYSPGYPEWDVAEQPRLLDLILRTRSVEFPSPVEALDSGMLRPKKTLLAVFGLTRHAEHLRPLTSLIPCESCSFGPCQYRRAPYRRAPRTFGERVAARPPALDADARYSVNRKALARWAEERLSIREAEDGALDAVFRYEGTTCTNMGRPLAFDYFVKLGSREEGYPIREQRCAPALGDTGHTYMCQYLADADTLMAAIDQEKPLYGQRLNAILDWHPPISAAGCFCDVPSRARKWALVLETLHYALVQQESAQDIENA